MTKMKEYFKNLLITVLIFPILLFIALVFSFMMSRFFPGDPVLAYLPEGTFDMTQYLQMKENLGLNDPLILQFIRYSLNMLSGNWGISESILKSAPVIELVSKTLPRTFDLLLIPLLVSLVIGFYIGKISLKRTNLTSRVTQIVSLVILAIPIMIIGIGFQFSLGGIFPIQGYKSVGHKDPPFVTGFLIIDSMLSGQWFFISDYLYHLILPWITLTIVLVPFIIFLTRSFYLNIWSEQTLHLRYPVSSLLATVALGYGMVMSFSFLVDLIFGLNGFGQLFINSIYNSDYWVLNMCGFIFPLIFTFLMSGSMLILTIYSYIKGDRSNNFKSEEMERKEKDLTVKDNMPRSLLFQNFKSDIHGLGKDLLIKLKSPYSIIGLGITLFAIIVIIFPNLLTPYSYAEVIGVSSNPLHILARIVYALPVSLIPVFISAGFSLIGGLIIGIIFNLVRTRYKRSLDGIMIPFFMFPIIFSGFFSSLMLISFYMGMQLLYLGSIYGVILIPIFTLIITKAKYNFVAVLKQVIPYIPLMMGFVLTIDTFLGFLLYSTTDLGGVISTARMYLPIAPWATFLPGLALFVLLLGFYLLYAGLRQIPGEVQDVQEIKRDI